MRALAAPAHIPRPPAFRTGTSAVANGVRWLLAIGDDEVLP